MNCAVVVENFILFSFISTRKAELLQFLGTTPYTVHPYCGSIAGPCCGLPSSRPLYCAVILNSS